MLIDELNYLRRIDWVLVFAVLILLTIGILSLASASGLLDGGDPARTIKQVIIALVGLILIIVFSRFDYRALSSLSILLYVALLLLLLASLVMGTRIRGTQAWVILGGINFEPSEFAKVLLPIIAAQFIVIQRRHLSHGRLLGGLSFIIGLPLLLVLLQPDLGSASLLLVLYLGLLFFTGIPFRHIIPVLLLVLAVVASSWLFVLAPYQKNRVLNFINPSRDPLGSGYQLHQSMIAVGSGGLMGRGLGLGPQSQLNFLPEVSTDFAFAKIAEELGFLGAGLVVTLLFVVLFRMVRIARAACDDFGAMLSISFAIIFLTQVYVNVSMNMALLPITGIPLPFVSAGGSSLVTSFATIGLLQSIWIRRNEGTDKLHQGPYYAR